MSTSKLATPGSQESLIMKAGSGIELMMGSYEFKYEVCNDLNEFFVDTARQNLVETPETVTTGLEGVRELLKDEPTLFVPDTDYFLTKFLRPCRWRPNRALKLIKIFYEHKINNPEYRNDYIPVNMKVAFDDGIVTPLPFRMADGSRVLVVQAGKRWNPQKIDVYSLFKVVALSLEALINEPKTQISGIHVILDMEGFTLSQVTYFSPTYASIVLDYAQNCLPGRIRGIHIINQSYAFNVLFYIFKPFIHEKLRSRLHFHGSDRESLFSHIDAKLLPKLYGGDLDFETDIASQSFGKYLLMFNVDFEECSMYGFIKENHINTNNLC